MLPSLSIVIPSHHRTDLLRACLATVTRHAPPGTEVLVVDDGSPAGEVRTAAAFAGVRVHRLERSGGFCAAANAGIRATSGTIVELLNDDTEVSAGWAEPSLAAFADPSVAAVAPLVLAWPGDGYIDSAGDRYYVGGVAGKRGHGRPLRGEYLDPHQVFGASGSSAFYRREALVKVGAFPESFRAYFEDVDLAFRLHWAGYYILYEPASRVLHHVSASYGRPRRELVAQQSQNEERVFWRNLPADVLLRSLPAHCAVLAAKAWRRWCEGRLTPFLCGRLRVLGELREMLRHRSWLRRLGRPDSRQWGLDARYWG